MKDKHDGTVPHFNVNPQKCTRHQRRVEEFMARAQQVIPDRPTIPSKEVCLLRAKLIMEECLETIKALGVNVGVRYHGTGADGVVPVTQSVIRLASNEFHDADIIGVADGCADISVVTIGTLSAFGIADQKLLEVVDASNLAKFSGDAHRREDGKWIKPSDWEAPDIAAVLRAQGWQDPWITGGNL